MVYLLISPIKTRSKTFEGNVVYIPVIILRTLFDNKINQALYSLTGTRGLHWRYSPVSRKAAYKYYTASILGLK